LKFKLSDTSVQIEITLTVSDYQLFLIKRGQFSRFDESQIVQ